MNIALYPLPICSLVAVTPVHKRDELEQALASAAPDATRTMAAAAKVWNAWHRVALARISTIFNSYWDYNHSLDSHSREWMSSLVAMTTEWQRISAGGLLDELLRVQISTQCDALSAHLHDVLTGLPRTLALAVVKILKHYVESSPINLYLSAAEAWSIMRTTSSVRPWLIVREQQSTIPSEYWAAADRGKEWIEWECQALINTLHDSFGAPA